MGSANGIDAFEERLKVKWDWRVGVFRAQKVWKKQEGTFPTRGARAAAKRVDPFTGG